MAHDHESIVIPLNSTSTSLYLPPLSLNGQVFFIPFQKSAKALNKNVIHIFDLESVKWDKKKIPNVPNAGHQGFCLVYADCIAVLCLTLVPNRSAACTVEIYKLKEMLSWEPVPLVSGTLRQIDLENCQCVKSNRNIVIASIHQYSLMLFVHQYSSQQPWIDISFKLPTVNTSYVLQSCSIVRHALYCSLSCTQSNGQQKVTVYKVDLDYAIENKEKQDLEVICNFAPNVIQCHLFMTSNGKAMTVNITQSSGKHLSTFELHPLNNVSVTLFEKDYAFGTKLLSVTSLCTTACRNNVLLVYFDTVYHHYYLEVIPLTHSS